MEALHLFFEKIKDDPRIGPLHISLYKALLSIQEERPEQRYLPINREELVVRSKIFGKNAYYRCLKELAAFGYIEYRPEHHPGKKSSFMLSVS